MLFNSIEFALFLPIVFFVYWFLLNRNLKVQNLFLLLVSYFFYACWDWKFLFLIIISSGADFIVGLVISNQKDQFKRNFFLLLSVSINLSILGFFKYFNFFIESFSEAFTLFGFSINPDRLSIILPVGISFYTFQTLSYTIDVYRKKITPTRDIVSFFCFVGFFPQLVAGPIERASNLLPQFHKKRKFNYESQVDGMRQILWGLFSKVVIADNVAIYVNDIFLNYENFSGSTLLLGSVFFAIQIYADFSGYSNIAIGSAKLFGFNLKQNFAFPYFSRNMGEFWRRWHISLTSWFKEYIYVPLGGSRTSRIKVLRNVLLIFLISGFWHGANWTFIAWGLINFVFFIPLLLLNLNRTHNNIVAENNFFPRVKDFFQILLTFLMTVLMFVFFRAESITDAFSYLGQILSGSLFEKLDLVPKQTIIIYTLLLFVVEWFNRTKKHGLELDKTKIHLIFRWASYIFLIISVILFGGNQNDFIYFQF